MHANASFDQAPVRLTWADGLLAIATDVAAGMDHLHGLGLYHGRIFLFNIMIMSNWRAKLSEYHLEPYLAAARDGRGAEGEHSLSASHGERGGQLPSPFFLSPERFGGRLPAMQSQLNLLRPVLRPRLCYVLQLLAGGCVMCYSFWRGLCYVLQPP